MQQTAPKTQVDPVQSVSSSATSKTVADRISVSGNSVIPSSAFDDAIRLYLGRSLSRDELRDLAGAVGAVARAEGYPFASAAVRQSPDGPGSLIVELDEGRVTAVRLLGTTNAAADRVLQTLVGDRPVTRYQLERTILLAGDVPGVRIVSSRFVREDGFGILFVEMRESRTSVYAQVDNRGSDEVGPIRSTFLGSVRGVVQAGDQLSVIAAQTPLDPKEFLFVRLQYQMPVGSGGDVLTYSGSFGRTNPGATLRRFAVIGHSYDAAIAYQRPLLRRRAASLWANLELRGTASDQALRGIPIRDDRMVALTASLSGDAAFVGGTLRGDAGVTWGLPLAGVTRVGDRLASRPDGSGRFVVGHAWLEWVRTVAGPVSVRLAGEGQIASRPLLAAAELGAGGPTFGRAFDYGERTGDQGVLGSAELRLDLPTDFLAPARSFQAYGFADGGYVDNLEDGFGGGTLVSAGGGIRVSFARLDLGLEAALPINTDRSDTGDRSARASFRIATRF